MTFKIENENLFREQGFLGGSWVTSGSFGFYELTNPADGKVIANIPRMSKNEVTSAIYDAEKALPVWRSYTAKERASILQNWFNLINKNSEDLAKIMTYEQGKPLAEARGEINYAASFVEWYAEEGKRINGEILQTTKSEQRHLVIQQAIGVGGGITPWNFPSAMLTRKVAPALAAGCTFILKPAEDTPLSALALAYLAEEAGLPRGVLSVITGSREDSKEIGLSLCKSDKVRKISFTGSTPVGKILLQQSASSVKKVSLELGGSSPLIIFDDADLDAAVNGTMSSKFRNAGQTCVCANRILVQRGIYKKYLEAMVEVVSKLRLGNGMEDGVNIGPIINQRGLKKIQTHVKDAENKGAKIILGGEVDRSLGELFFKPTIIEEVDVSMMVMNEETFGPVLPIMVFDDDSEAIEIANDTPSGLAAYFFSQDIARVIKVSEALEYGIVSVNTGIFSSETVPFGGVKQSGIGREGARQGIEEWCETKFICIGNL